MACRGFFECILKLLNFLLTLAGLAMVGYGIYLFVEYKQSSSDTVGHSPIGADKGLVQLGRPLLVTVTLSASFWDSLSKAWFIFLFIGVGVVLFIISCFGCIGTVTRNRCCLTCYSVLVILLILVELGCAAFIYFDKSWETDLPTDTSGDFDMIYDFLKEHWTIVRWVALGVVVLEVFIGNTLNRKTSPEHLQCPEHLAPRITDFMQLQALVFLLALIVRAANRPPEYDSDDEYIGPRQQIRQPMLGRAPPPPPPAASVPLVGAVDQRPSRSDAWSTRMREKYGLDTAEFTYNPTEPNRYQQASTQPTEERSRCTIM